MQKVLSGQLPVNHAIMGNLQDVFNLLPNLTTPVNGEAPNGTGNESNELARAMSVKTNDQLMTIYLSSLIRAITAFHDLIENKIQNRQAQEEKDAKKEEEKEGKKTNGETNGEKKDGKEAETNVKEDSKEKESGKKKS